MGRRMRSPAPPPSSSTTSSRATSPGTCLPSTAGFWRAGYCRNDLEPPLAANEIDELEITPDIQGVRPHCARPGRRPKRGPNTLCISLRVEPVDIGEHDPAA